MSKSTSLLAKKISVSKSKSKSMELKKSMVLSTEAEMKEMLEKKTLVHDVSYYKTLIKEGKPTKDPTEARPDKKNITIKDDSSYIVLNNYFFINEGLYSVVKRNVEKKQNTLLLGPTGIGKTEMVSCIASELQLPITIFDMGTMSDPIMSLVGTNIIQVKDGKTSSSFTKSRFSEVIQKPGIVLLDELSRASATANNLLFPCLDFRKELAMEYCFEDTTPIKVHPDCVFFATANLGSQYTGTHKLDRALLDRFMTVEMDPLDAHQLLNVLSVYTNNKLVPSVITAIVEIYEKINKLHDEFKISFNLSMRHLKLICDLVIDNFTIYDSFYVISKGLGGQDGVKSIQSVLETAKKR